MAARPPVRTLMGTWTDFGTWQRVYETPEAIEVDESNGLTGTRHRVFYDEVLLVTYHTYVGWALAALMAMVSASIGLVAGGVALAGQGRTAVTIGFFAALAAAFAVIRVVVKVDALTIYGRRSRARASFWLNRDRGRAAFQRVCARVRRAQAPAPAAAAGGDVQKLIAALQGDTPLVSDLRALTDEIGGRPTGSEANRRSVEWALGRFRDAGVTARAESFSMPRLWLERSARASVGGDASFDVRVAAMPFSSVTAPAGFTAPLVDGGTGGDGDFLRLGESVRGAFLLVETRELKDLEGLFREYAEASSTERRALGAGAAGVVYMSSRPHGLLYRHLAGLGAKNAAPLLIMDREAAGRVLRLLRDGRRLALTAVIDAQDGGAYPSQNVIAEIRGRERPQEVVIVGAHLDSWDLGTGALDNGCNVAMLIDVARQIQRLGLRPRRTIRIALWNGEEQGLFGSWGYAHGHAAELDRHVMAGSFDIGSGRITGFFTNGRGAEITPTLDAALKPVADLGPYTHVDEPVVGTDNFDFMMEGVANLVAVQADATYGPDYHASSDTFDKVDVAQLRKNAAVAAAVLWGFAEADAPWGRQSGEQVQKLVETTTLKDQMVSFGVFDDWRSGKRGRKAR